MITIPQSSLQLHEEVFESFLNTFGKNCTLYYPSVPIKCPNCNGGYVYNGTGPVPFSEGICPYCGGVDQVNSEQTEDIKLLIYYTPKEWVEYQKFEKDIAKGMVQTRGLMSDWPKVQRANYLRVNKDISGLGFLKYEKYGDMIPYGVRFRTEFLQMLVRST